MHTVLIVDDEYGIRELLSEILEDEGYQVLTAENAKIAQSLVGKHDFDLILLDIWMPDMDGISLLKEWYSHNTVRCPIVMMSGHGTIETAMEATRFGAMDDLDAAASEDVQADDPVLGARKGFASPRKRTGQGRQRRSGGLEKSFLLPSECFARQPQRQVQVLRPLHSHGRLFHGWNRMCLSITKQDRLLYRIGSRSSRSRNALLVDHSKTIRLSSRSQRCLQYNLYLLQCSKRSISHIYRGIGGLP